MHTDHWKNKRALKGSLIFLRSKGSVSMYHIICVNVHQNLSKSKVEGGKYAVKEWSIKRVT